MKDKAGGENGLSFIKEKGVRQKAKPFVWRGNVWGESLKEKKVK